MSFKKLSSTPFIHRIFSLLHILDCLFYLIAFSILFIFITFIAFFGEHNVPLIYPLLITILAVQIIRLFVFFSIKQKQNFQLIVKETGITFIIGFMFIIYSVLKPLKGQSSSTFINFLSLATSVCLLMTYLVLTYDRVRDFLNSFRLNFFRSFTTSFFFLILLGTWLISLPISRTVDIPFINIIFDVTSAVTVTGFSTINITQDLTFFGQVVFLLLFQIGGIGIITFSMFFLLNTKQKIAYEQRISTLSVFNQQEMSNVKKTIYTVLVSTLIIESLGAILIFLQLPVSFEGVSEHHLFYSIFFSIAAFCNAGFSLFPDSATLFAYNPSILYTLSGLTLLGGLGFVVFSDLAMKLKHFFYKKKHPHTLSLFSKIVIVMTLFFTLIGFIGYALLEWNASLAEFDPISKLHNALFQGINTRIGGFNSVNPDQIKPATLIFMSCLSFIGGAPGSTAGGIKITTFCVLVVALFSLIKNQSVSKINFFHFSIDHNILYKGFNIFFLRISLTIVAVFLLSLHNFELGLYKLLFEVVSALSNTGYSVIDPVLLSSYTKILLAILMFIGRIGSFYLFSLIFNVRKKSSSINEYKTISIPLE